MGVAIFAILAGAVTAVLFTGQEGVLQSGHQVRAVFLTEEALAAARAIRDASFDQLTAGKHGVCVGASGQWEFCGESRQTEDGFSTSLTVEALSESHARVTAETRWREANARSGAVLLVEELFDWRSTKPIGDWASPDRIGSFVIVGVPLFSSITLKGSIAFVTSEEGNGGKGLQAYDYSSDGDPLPIATGFDLGVSAFAALVSGDELYVATADSSAEIQVFDVTAPEQLSMTKRLATINLPGEGRARSLAVFGETLFVGMTEDAAEPELAAYDVSDPAAPSPLGELQDTTSVFGLGLHDGFAYVAGSQDAMELRVADVFDPEALSIAPGEGFNLTDVHDALSLTAVNSDLLVGRRSGDGIEELVLLDIGHGAIPASPPGPWYQEIGGSVPSVTAEPGGRFAFAATDNTSAQLQVVDLTAFRAGQFPVIATETTPTGGGRAVAYDAQRDRVLLATDTALLLFRPGP